ncbi:unnamed protein product [Moneuplotes crassus]|uniref:Uncharacterized protein n=1 Tax=Euplotes crassus TaxID=5936 RepID=A0AAD2D180_EUPCR|nr:unnamed protein product [Moneuplotes crassus]
MKVKKITSVVNTVESKRCDLNRKLRQNNLMTEIKKRERNISQQNQKMFQRLASIVSRPNQIRFEGKGPNSLNFGRRKSEMRRIMKSNIDILKNIKNAKPALPIKDLQKRFLKNEKYKTIVSTYDEYGKKEDPVERYMHQVYYDVSPSPRKKIDQGSSRATFKPRTKRKGSIDAKKMRWTGAKEYPGVRSFQFSPSKERSDTQRPSMFPSISDLKERFMSVDQFNSMISNEMADIRKIKKGKKKCLKSVQQVFQNHEPSTQDHIFSTSMNVV